MGSIPLAIANPLDLQGKILENHERQQGLTSVLQQQELQKQRIQQQEISLKDQKAGSDAMHAWDGQSLDDLPGLYIKHGASANAVLKLKTDIQDYTGKKTTQQKAQLENEKLLHDNMAGGLDAIAALPKESWADALEKFKASPDVINGLDPTQRIAFDQSLEGLAQRARSGDDISRDLQILKNEHLAESQITENATKQQDLLTKQQDLADKKLANQKTQAALDAQNAWLAKPENAGKTAADFEIAQAGAKSEAEASGKITGERTGMGPGRAVGTGLDVQEANDWLSKNPGKSLSDYQTFKAEQLAKFNYNLQAGGVPANPATQTKTGQEFLQSLPPARQQLIKTYAEGRQTFPTGMALRTPYWQGIQRDLLQYDPQWSEQRAEIRKNFTVGKDADNIGSLNTAAVHLDALGEAAKALANGSFRPGNAAWNALQTMFGGSAPTTFETIKNAVAGEQANALKGSATDPEIANVSKTISGANSPQQLADSIEKASLPIMFQKLNTYKERYEQQLPNDSVYSPVLPSARSVFEKHGVGKSSALPAKILTQAAVEKAAKDHNITVAVATKQATEAGYTVK